MKKQPGILNLFSDFFKAVFSVIVLFYILFSFAQYFAGISDIVNKIIFLIG